MYKGKKYGIVILEIWQKKCMFEGSSEESQVLMFSHRKPIINI